MPQLLRSEVDLPRAWSSGISTLTVIIAVSVVPPDIVAGGPMGACRRFLSVQLASPFMQLYVHPGSAMKLCVLRDRDLELKASHFVDHPFAASVILASESYNPSLSTS